MMPRYEVRTVEWVRWEFSERPHKARAPMSATVSKHATYAGAVVACDEVNAKMWANLECNPFHYGGETLFFQSTFPPGPFCDYLEDRGIDLPASGPDTDNAGWAEWYKSGRRKRSSHKSRRKRFTPVQMAALREVMNLVSFAEVVEVPDAVAKGYLIQELNWEMNYNPTIDPDPEGGMFIAVYRSRSKAEARCARLNAARQADEYYAGCEFDTRGRKGATEPFQTPAAGTAFYEVVEVDLDVRYGSP